MAKYKVTNSKKYDDMDGVWRTIKGRHIFIRKGQSLKDAMKDSGKFDKKEEINSEEQVKKTNKAIEKEETKTEEQEKGKQRKHLPRNMSKDIYELDVDKGNAWSGNAVTKNAKGEEVMIAYRNGESQNSAEDIVKALQGKYPELDAIISDRGNEIMFKLKKESDKEDKWYYGKDAYEKYGDALKNKYAGVEISKRIDDADKPNGLRTIAKELGAKDEFEVLEAIEGLGHNGGADEIDDSTYRIKGNKKLKITGTKSAGDVFDASSQFNRADINKFKMGQGMSPQLIKAYAREQAIGVNERNVNKVLEKLNNEGSDFTFGSAKIENGKIKTDVGVFMPDERGYVNRDLEIPINKDDTNIHSISAKLRDWQSRHSSPDTFYDKDFYVENPIKSKPKYKYSEEAFENFNAERDLKIGDIYIDGSGKLRKVIDRPAKEGRLERKLAKAFVPGKENIKGTKWETEELRTASPQDYADYFSVDNRGTQNRMKLGGYSNYQDYYKDNGTDEARAKLEANINKPNKAKKLTIAEQIRKGKLNKEEDSINDTYSIGKFGKGIYVQFQDVSTKEHEEITKYPRVSPKEKSNTWARVWNGKKLIYNNDTGFNSTREGKYEARANVAKFLDERNKAKRDKFEVSELKSRASKILPKEDIDTHDSDLYIRKSEASSKLISNMKNKNSGLLSTFRDDNGSEWYDIPFGNMQDDYKSKVKESRPVAKKLAEQKQGRSNRKEVSNKIQKHILDYYSKDFGWDTKTREEGFETQLKAMGTDNGWRAGEEIAKGGSYLIYTDDMRKFLDKLNINPKNKKFTDEQVFKTYTSLIGRESKNLYNLIQKEKTMTQSQLIKSLMNRGYSKKTAEKMAKQQIKRRK